jgi:hypothetical protein
MFTPRSSFQRCPVPAIRIGDSNACRTRTQSALWARNCSESPRERLPNALMQRYGDEKVVAKSIQGRELQAIDTTVAS